MVRRKFPLLRKLKSVNFTYNFKLLGSMLIINAVHKIYLSTKADGVSLNAVIWYPFFTYSRISEYLTLLVHGTIISQHD